MNTRAADEETKHRLPFVNRHYKKGIFVALALLLWPLLISFPWSTNALLDGSWPEVLQYAHLKGWQFGRDIVFTWGPWGFLNNQFHLGAAGATAKILWETLGKLTIAAALVALTRKIPLFWQVLFIIACILFSWIFLDTIFLVLITLIVMGGLMAEKTPRGQQLLCVVALAFLGQIKFTYAVFACSGLVFSALFHILRKDYAETITQTAGFGVAFLAFWMGAGQNPDNLLPFFRTGLEISAGYGWAMGVDERRPVFLCCLALALVCAVFLFRLWRKLPDRPLAWAATLYLASTWFVVWKHGLIRADGHEFGFVLYSLLLALPLPYLCIRDIKWHWFSLAAALGVGCLQIIQPGLPGNCPRDAETRFVTNYSAMGHLGSLPAKWENEFNHAAQPADLPWVRQIIGKQSIDLFNYDQGVVLLNRFNYKPRPIFQSYSAYTPALMSRNLRFYQSPQAPDYILWNHSSIDDRFPTLDDALLIPELPRAYQPVLEEGSYILLKKQSTLPARRLDQTPLLDRSLSLDEVLILPKLDGTPIWIRAKLRLNKLGKLRAFLYKPPLIRLTVTDETGRETSWRILPRVAREGFLLSPFLETQSDFAAFCRGHGQHWIRSLKFETPRKQKEFWPHHEAFADVSLSILPPLPSTSALSSP